MECTPVYSSNISQGRVATSYRSGGNFSELFIANFLPSLPVKEFSKLVNVVC